MAKVEVWNDNKFAHTEKFKGETVHIPSGKYVEMDMEDAIDFRGQFFQPVKDGNDKQTPESYKMIRIGKALDKKAVPEKSNSDLVCQKCKYEGESKLDLENHINENHLADLEDQEFAAKRRKGRPPNKKADNDGISN